MYKDQLKQPHFSIPHLSPPGSGRRRGHEHDSVDDHKNIFKWATEQKFPQELLPTKSLQWIITIIFYLNCTLKVHNF